MQKNIRRNIHNKENLFTQVASRKSTQSIGPIRRFSQETYKYADDHYEDLLAKIKKLDEENLKMREILKKMNYHQLQHVEMSSTKKELHLDLQNLSEIKIKSRDTSMDETKFPNSARNQDKKQFSSIAAKQVSVQKQTDALINNYTLDMLNDIDDNQYFGVELYKDMLFTIISKDNAIFRQLHQSFTEEQDKNYSKYIEGYKQNTNQLNTIFSQISQYVNKLEQQQFLHTSYNQLQGMFTEMQKIIDRIKLFLIPLNNIGAALQERENDIDSMHKLMFEGNKKIQSCLQTIDQMRIKNIQLQEENHIFQICFDKLCVNENFEEAIEECIQSLIKIQDNNNLQNKYQSHKKQSFKSTDDSLFNQIVKLQQAYDTLKQKGYNNKLKFKKVLLNIYDQIDKSKRVEGFEHLSFQQQEQLICQSLKIK